MKHRFQPINLAVVLVLVSALVVPANAVADIIPPDIAACHNAEEGDSCERAMGTTEGGTCVEAPCRGKDYSNGAPPEYYYYACLKCLSAENKERLEEQIDSGEVKSPDELPSQKRSRPDDGIEILRRGASRQGNSPDVPDDEDGDGGTNNQTDNDDQGDENETSEDDGSTQDASSSGSTPTPDAGESPHAAAPSSKQDAKDNGSTTNILVTAGSIGLGLFIVVVGFRRRSRDDA